MKCDVTFCWMILTQHDSAPTWIKSYKYHTHEPISDRLLSHVNSKTILDLLPEISPMQKYKNSLIKHLNF